MEQLISVIIPVFNSERYLKKCLESVMEQTYTNLEIILVDDGSSDASKDIINQYLKKDNRIVYVYQNNAGSVKARKRGLDISKGEYVVFVDSDDWIESGLISYLHQTKELYNCDLVTTGYIRDYDNNRASVIVYDNYIEGKYEELENQIYPTMIHNFQISKRGMDCTLVGRLFKKDILLKINEKFDDRIMYGDDALIYAYLLNVKSVYISKKVFYHYIIHNNSICRSITPNMVINNHLLFNYLLECIKGQEGYECLLHQLRRYMIDLEIHNLKYLYGIGIKSYAKWEFGFDEEIYNSNIVIYGAGDCGIALYNKIINGYKGNILAWVDINYKSINRIMDSQILSPDILCDLTGYDYLILAVDSEKIVEEIKKNCINKYNINENMILYNKYVSYCIFE